MKSTTSRSRLVRHEGREIGTKTRVRGCRTSPLGLLRVMDREVGRDQPGDGGVLLNGG